MSLPSFCVFDERSEGTVGGVVGWVPRNVQAKEWVYWVVGEREREERASICASCQARIVVALCSLIVRYVEIGKGGFCRHGIMKELARVTKPHTSERCRGWLQCQVCKGFSWERVIR